MEEIKLNDIIAILWRRKGILFGSIAFFLIIALFWAFFIVEPGYRVEVPLRLEHFEYNIEPHRRGYLSQFFRGVGFESEDDSGTLEAILQEALAAEDYLPPSTLTVDMEARELLLAFQTDNPREIEEQLPNLLELLNNSLVAHHEKKLDQLRGYLSTLINFELSTINGQLQQIEGEIRAFEEEGNIFLIEQPEPILDPLYSDLARRQGELIMLRSQLQQELQDLEQMQIRDHILPHFIEPAGPSHTVSLMPRRRIVVGIAGVLGFFVGLFLVYILSIATLRESVSKKS
jgi:uncharacterized protein involved in exopolysaccharide biosynthesis